MPSGNKASPRAALVGEDDLPDFCFQSHKHVHVLPHTETVLLEWCEGGVGKREPNLVQA